MEIEQTKKELSLAISPLEQQAISLAVRDQGSYDAAADLAKRAVSARKQITEKLAPSKQAAHKAWKAIVALENEMLSLVTGAEEIIKGKLVAFQAEQETKRREEQRLLEEEARKRAEEERITEAIAAEREGADPDEIQQILEEPVVEDAVVVPPTFEKSKGISARVTWEAQVTNLLKLVQHCAQHPTDILLLQPNQTALNQRARSQKQLMEIPGVKAVRKTHVAVRS